MVENNRAELSGRDLLVRNRDVPGGNPKAVRIEIQRPAAEKNCPGDWAKYSVAPNVRAHRAIAPVNLVVPCPELRDRRAHGVVAALASHQNRYKCAGRQLR